MLSLKRLSIIVSILLTLPGVLPAENAAFSDAALKGSYSFSTSLRTANTSTNQFAMVGVMTFDGAGNVAGSYTSISADTVQTGSLGGTYTVNANGTGTISLTTGSTAEFAISLNSTTGGIAGGVQLLQINDSNNEIVSGTAVLQSATTQTYSVATLKGNFSLQYNPWTTEAGLSEDGGVGVFSFDGKGNIKSTIITIYGGARFGGSGSFTYTVNSDGSGTIAEGKGPQIAFVVNTVTNGLARGFQFLDTNTSDGPGNMVITGSAAKQ